MSLFNSYLRSRIKAIAVCIAVICIFSASYLLFDMPVIFWGILHAPQQADPE